MCKAYKKASEWFRFKIKCLKKMRKYNLHGHSFGHGHFLTKFSRPVSRAECFVFQFDNKLTVLCSP